MHELSVCRALIREAEAAARRHGAVGVAKLSVRVGALSGVEPVLLRHAFEAARTGSGVEGAGLIVEWVPVRVVCDACGVQSEARANRLLCAACGDWRTRLVSGDELTLASVELLFEEAGVQHV